MSDRSAHGLTVDFAPSFGGAPCLDWAADVLSDVWADRFGGPSAEAVEQVVHVTDIGAPDAHEAFELVSSDREVRLAASDARGAAYGLLELADRLRFSGDPGRVLREIGPMVQRPATALRGVLRSFSSDVLDAGWFRSPAFWRGYLDELANDRINRVHLAFGMQYNFSHDLDVRDNYLCFAYPFLVDVPGWDVEVGGVDAAEREANLAALRYASDEAARRGIDFHLGLWNHAVRPELGESPHLRYPISGLGDADVAAYSAEALELLLDRCPSISGLTFRVHYEGGVHEHGRGDFWRTVLAAVKRAGRPIAIDMHSKGVDEEMLRVARDAGDRVTVSAKYWAEHQGLPYHQTRVRDLERARPGDPTAISGITQNTRRFTRYGFGDFLRTDRGYDFFFRVWPGSQRFLLWGDPAIFAGYGRHGTIGGSLGIELCEPLTFRGRKDSGRDGRRDLYADESLALPADADWTKYRYTYRLWGRLLYDPDTPPGVWRRFLRQEYGDAAAPVERGLAAASRVLPLMTVAQGISASNNFYWPEVMWNLPIGGPGHAEEYDFDTPEPGSWGAVSPFDPGIFTTTDQCADDIAAGSPSAGYTPLQVAEWMDALARDAKAALEDLAADDRPAVRRAVVDILAQAHLATFFAAKLRAGVAYALFERTGDVGLLAECGRRYRQGRDAYRQVVAVTNGVYIDNLGFGDRTTEQGHWRDRLAQIEADVADLERRLEQLDPHGETAPTGLPSVRTAAPGLDHEPPTTFAPGADLRVTARSHDGDARVHLHYRHLNHGEDYERTQMHREDGAHSAVIPASYTASPYPLAYYFTVHGADSTVALAPGLGAELADRPYHVITPRSLSPQE